jgi:hypothetical protein
MKFRTTMHFIAVCLFIAGLSNVPCYAWDFDRVQNWKETKNSHFTSPPLTHEAALSLANEMKALLVSNSEKAQIQMIESNAGFQVELPKALHSKIEGILNRQDVLKLDHKIETSPTKPPCEESDPLGSEMRKVGLSQTQIMQLRAHSILIGADDDFSWCHPKEKTPGLKVLIGIDESRFNTYKNVWKKCENELIDWREGNQHAGVSWKSNADSNKFLDFYTKGGDQIFFLVPPQLLLDNRSKWTREELEYFLNRPEKSKNVTFIFGAYDHVYGSYYDPDLDDFIVPQGK